MNLILPSTVIIEALVTQRRASWGQSPVTWDAFLGSTESNSPCLTSYWGKHMFNLAAETSRPHTALNMCDFEGDLNANQSVEVRAFRKYCIPESAVSSLKRCGRICRIFCRYFGESAVSRFFTPALLRPDALPRNDPDVEAVYTGGCVP